MRFIPKIILPVFLLLCFYIGYRLYGYLRQIFPRINKIAYWAVYAVFPLCFMLSAYLPVSVFARFLAVIGNYYLSIFVFSIFLLVIAEIVRLILYICGVLPPKGEKRRKLHIASGSVVCILLLAIIVGGAINAFTIRTTDYDIQIHKKCSIDSLKLVAVSDIHLGYQIGAGYLEDVVEEINAQKPDIVCIVGDIFDSSTDMVFDLSRAAEVFSRIQSKYGVYAVLGNHDVYTNAMEEFYADSNITLLRDEYVLIADSFYIVGRNDRNLLTGDRYSRADMSEIVKDIDKTKPVIVLDHRPMSFEEEKENGADLVLSGHTHEGQFFPISLITDKIYSTDYGHGVYGDMQVIVTSGAGLWGPPIRIGTRAEIAAVNIRFSN